jgi:hypothetical protein
MIPSAGPEAATERRFVAGRPRLSWISGGAVDEFDPATGPTNVSRRRRVELVKIAQSVCARQVAAQAATGITCGSGRSAVVIFSRPMECEGCARRPARYTNHGRLGWLARYGGTTHEAAGRLSAAHSAHSSSGPVWAAAKTRRQRAPWPKRAGRRRRATKAMIINRPKIRGRADHEDGDQVGGGRQRRTTAGRHKQRATDASPGRPEAAGCR